MAALIPYSQQETEMLTKIARSDRKQWKELLREALAKTEGREYNSLYTKTNQIANSMGLKSPLSAIISKARKKGLAKKKKNEQMPTLYPKNKKVYKQMDKKKDTKRRHPMKEGELAVQKNEIRFAYKGIRLENGEVIISI